MSPSDRGSSQGAANFSTGVVVSIVDATSGAQSPPCKSALGALRRKATGTVELNSNCPRENIVTA